MRRVAAFEFRPFSRGVFFTSLLQFVKLMLFASHLVVRQMAGDRNFMWADEETVLLLRVVLDFIVGTAGEGVDW